jgi:hypothetical protein
LSTAHWRTRSHQRQALSKIQHSLTHWEQRVFDMLMLRIPPLEHAERLARYCVTMFVSPFARKLSGYATAPDTTD